MLERKPMEVPAKTATVAMWITLGALTMGFFASMLAYLLVRVVLPPPSTATTLTRAHLPGIFLVSTLVVFAASYTIQKAVSAIRQEKQGQMRWYIWLTFALSILFCVLQVPGLVDVYQQHVPRTQDGANLSRMLFCLIIYHAMHVLGGVIYLGVVASRARRGFYDHEHYIGVKHAALYWHFLDVVWVIMYAVMLTLG